MPVSLAGAVGLEPTISWLTARRIANYATPQNDLHYKFARVVPNEILKQRENLMYIFIINLKIHFSTPTHDAFNTIM